jgi:hypothetical protein
MSPVSYMKPSCYALGAALALSATTASANLSAPQTLVPQTSVKLAVVDSTEAVAGAAISIMPHSYRPSEAGVRRAAAQGPEALRRYIWRTRIIYNYYFWNFVEQE